MVLKIQSSSIEVVKTNSLPILMKKEAVRELMSSRGRTTEEPCSSLLLWRDTAPVSTISLLHRESSHNDVFHKIFFLIYCLP